MAQQGEEEKKNTENQSANTKILPTLQATATTPSSVVLERNKAPRHPPLSVPNRRHRCKSVLSRPSHATNTEKTTRKLTQTTEIAIVRGFREYPDRAVRNIEGVEGRRKAQAN
jgi:hypothetical protein